ncbi:MAG: NAD(P)H-hydrate epimerase [Planctomycetes bacterium]|nr:NAD(P)H-hydrate epimerase [Planctomycetota bacterium]
MRDVTAAEMREIDRRATAEFGIPSLLLMENAARSTADVVAGICADARRDCTEARAAARGRLGPVHVLCGPGNNGGDGFGAARHLHNRALPVAVHIFESLDRFSGKDDSARQLEMAQRLGLRIYHWPAEQLPVAAGLWRQGRICVDALFGTGLRPPLRPPYDEVVRALQAIRAPVVALDLPSGLDATTGEAPGPAIEALATIALGLAKTGYARDAGPLHTGEVVIVDIGLPRPLVVG